MECPQVSILVPIYNVEAYVTEALDSLFAQTFTDFEVICINDGSSDDSLTLIQRFIDKDARFRVIDKTNSGYGDSMNKGLLAARGSYVGILEPDDVMEPHALERLMGAATRFNADVAKGNFWFYWSKPEEKRISYEVVPQSYCGRLIVPAQEPHMFYAKPSIWSALYKRSFLSEHHIDFLTTPGASFQDTSFTFKVWAAAKRAVFIPEAVVSYRQDNESSSINNPGKARFVMGEYAEIERWLCERPHDWAVFEGLKERVKFDAYLWNYDRLETSLKADFLDAAGDEFLHDLRAGDVDLSLFSASEKADLEGMMYHRVAFAQSRAFVAPGKLNTLRRYWTLGGPRLVGRILAAKTGEA